MAIAFARVSSVPKIGSAWRVPFFLGVCRLEVRRRNHFPANSSRSYADRSVLEVLANRGETHSPWRFLLARIVTAGQLQQDLVADAHLHDLHEPAMRN